MCCPLVQQGFPLVATLPPEDSYFTDMNLLMQSLDYRAWLKARAEEIKAEKPYFSYRYIGLKLGLDSGNIARVLTGQAHIALKHIPALAELYGLIAQEQKYLEELVRFCRARNDAEAQRHYDRMQTIRGLEYRTVADDEAEFFEEWQHMALRSLLSVANFRGKSLKEIGSRLKPEISAEQVEKSLELLQRLSLVIKKPNGEYHVTDSMVSTGEGWKTPVIRKYQKTLIQMSADAIERFHKSERDISSLTLPFSRKTLPILRDRLRELRQEMLKLSQDCDPSDSIYQINLQLFPMAYLLDGEIRKGSSDE